MCICGIKLDCPANTSSLSNKKKSSNAAQKVHKKQVKLLISKKIYFKIQDRLPYIVNILIGIDIQLKPVLTEPTLHREVRRIYKQYSIAQSFCFKTQVVLTVWFRNYIDLIIRDILFKAFNYHQYESTTDHTV